MDIKIPNLGEGADTGTVVSIHVKEGDVVKKDQTLLELENEKAVAPIPSTQAGTVSKILVKVGDKVSVGQSIVQLSEGGNGASSSPQAAPAAPQQARPAQAAPQQAAPVSYAQPSSSGLPPAASPSVRKMAQDLGIDLTRVQGTESGGRISLADVRNYVMYLQSLAQGGAHAAPAAAAPKPPAESIDFSKWGPVHKKAVSSLRQKIAQKMTESWTMIPHVTQFEDVDITALLELRKKHVDAYEKKGTKLTLTSFVLKAVVAALKKHPQFNSSLDEATQEIVYKDYYNLGVAVDTEQGLIVPVLKGVDKKSMLEISKELEELAEKTRSRKIAADDLKGGTFTVSNLGGIGGKHFTPIINKPEVAILGTGKGFKSGTKTILPIGVSYDHRVVDGADGARFTRTLAEALESFDEKAAKL
jgi:pyruvate dehydrogenase E2 component (dihydrolipoamide acetyltransferase)